MYWFPELYSERSSARSSEKHSSTEYQERAREDPRYVEMMSYIHEKVRIRQRTYIEWSLAFIGEITVWS